MSRFSTIKNITEKQLAFVDAYFGEAEGNISKAYKIAYGKGEKKPAYAVFKAPAVQALIKERREKREATSWITHDQILEGLYKEATNYENGANSASRISAWVWIGKHLGMWQEKKEEQKEANITYNIVNFSEENKKEEKVVTVIEEEKTSLPSDVQIKDFNE